MDELGRVKGGGEEEEEELIRAELSEKKESNWLRPLFDVATKKSLFCSHQPL